MTDQGRVATIDAATDFSENARGAIAWAAEIARAHGAKLVVFHAQLPPISPSAAPEFVPIPPETYEEERRRAEAALAELARELREAGCEVETGIEAGPTASTILEAVAGRKADLLVVGTRGLTGFQRILLGSTAARLVREAPCPVLTVHPEAAARPRRIHRILVPIDFSSDAGRALDAAMRVLGRVTEDRHVTLLHVYRLPHEIVSPWPGAVLVEATRNIGEEARRRLEEVAAPLRKRGLQVETIAREGYPADVIDAEARRADADLIAMGTHGRSGLKRLFLGSTAERVLPAAPCPVLTIRRSEG